MVSLSSGGSGGVVGSTASVGISAGGVGVAVGSATSVGVSACGPLRGEPAVAIGVAASVGSAVGSAAGIGVDWLAGRGRFARGLLVGVGESDEETSIAAVGSAVGSAVGCGITVGASISASRTAAGFAGTDVAGAEEGIFGASNDTTSAIGVGRIGVGMTIWVGIITSATAVTIGVLAMNVGAAVLIATSARAGVSSSGARAPTASTTSAQAAPISEI
jgi:hypothetical protein